MLSFSYLEEGPLVPWLSMAATRVAPYISKAKDAVQNIGVRVGLASATHPIGSYVVKDVAGETVENVFNNGIGKPNGLLDVVQYANDNVGRLRNFMPVSVNMLGGGYIEKPFNAVIDKIRNSVSSYFDKNTIPNNPVQIEDPKYANHIVSPDTHYIRDMYNTMNSYAKPLDNHSYIRDMYNGMNDYIKSVDN